MLLAGAGGLSAAQAAAAAASLQRFQGLRFNSEEQLWILTGTLAPAHVAALHTGRLGSFSGAHS